MTESNALAVSDNGHVFSGIQAFDAAQRMAKALSSSQLVPEIYQGQQGLANSLIALEIAGRMRMSPLLVMQNLHIVKGRPSWSSQFLIAKVNADGRFTPLRFAFDDQDNPTWCYAEAKEISSGEILRGEKITLEMVKREGWWSKTDRNGKETSKWQSFPGQMFRYRAASFWARVYCPEISLGIITKEEAVDVETVEVSVASSTPAPPAVAVLEPVEPEPEAVVMVKSDTLTAALAAIEAAPDGAPMGKFQERANQLLSENKINDQEYAEIAEAIESRRKDVPTGGGAINEKPQRQQPTVARQQAAATTEPAPAPIDTTGDAVPEALATGHDDDSAAPAVDLGSPAEPDLAAGVAETVDLKLRDRQSLIRSVNGCAPERRAAFLASLSLDSPAQLRTQAHADAFAVFTESK
jgi:hypothetical protein